QVLAIAIENLDPVRQVSNVKLVLVIEGGHARLVQPARMRAVHSPDQVGHRSLLEVTACLEERDRNQPPRGEGPDENTMTRTSKPRHPARLQDQELSDIGRKAIGTVESTSCRGLGRKS